MQTSSLSFVARTETPRELEFTVDKLPKPGYYKLQVFACKRPKRRGRMKLPLVATLLIDYQISANKEQTKFQGLTQRLNVPRLPSRYITSCKAPTVCL